MKKYLGIDIGGSKIKYGVYDESGMELSNSITDCIQNNKETLIALLERIIKDHNNIDGIGISVPGIINPNTGIISSADNVPAILGMNIKEQIENLVNIRVEVENDANCVALAENWLGNGKDIDDFICITIGTAIGGSIIIDNKLFSGKNNLAGEFGYMIIDNPYNVPNTKDYGNLASTRNLINMVSEELMIESTNIDGEYIFKQLKQNDLQVKKIYYKWLRYVAIGIRNLNFVLNPQKVLIGGGISIQSKLIEDLKSEVYRIMPSDQKEINIDSCKYLNDSGKIGAIYNLISKRDL